MILWGLIVPLVRDDFRSLFVGDVLMTDCVLWWLNLSHRVHTRTHCAISSWRLQIAIFLWCSNDWFCVVMTQFVTSSSYTNLVRDDFRSLFVCDVLMTDFVSWWLNLSHRVHTRTQWVISISQNRVITLSQKMSSWRLQTAVSSQNRVITQPQRMSLWRLQTAVSSWNCHYKFIHYFRDDLKLHTSSWQV